MKRNSPTKNFLLQSLHILFALLLSVPFLSHAADSRFFYDELGRLQAEVDAQGNTAVYSYDAVGNLLSITRSDVAASGVSISFFNPASGIIGSTVEIFGSGFSTTPTDNLVTFNGTPATVFEDSFEFCTAGSWLRLARPGGCTTCNVEALGCLADAYIGGSGGGRKGGC